MVDIQANTDKICKFIYDKNINEEIDDTTLVEIIKLCGNLLNLQTITDHAKTNKMSYQGVKKFRNVIELFNVKFVIS